MENYFIFDEKELARIGIVCPDCNTESVFDLSRDQAADRSRKCPGCGGEILPVFQSPNEYSYNAVTQYVRSLRSWEKKPKLLLYFKKP